jgi:D-amino peptidase
MKVYIKTDLEGVSGVSSSLYISASKNRPDLIAEARRLLALDINACVEGCVRAGATEIVIKDGHGGGFNVTRAQVDSRADLIDGDTPGDSFPDLEGSVAAILLGYHAMAGTAGAVCEHTMSSIGIQNVWLNGRKVGEVGLLAAIAAERNVPVVMVSGDDKTCLEAADWIPGVVTCEVKKGFSCNGARMPPLEVSHKLITEKTVEALKNIPSKVGIGIEYPVKLRTELVSRGRIPENPAYTAYDARTSEITSDSVEKAMRFHY